MNLKDQLIYSNERCRNVAGIPARQKSADAADALFHPDDRGHWCATSSARHRILAGLEQPCCTVAASLSKHYRHLESNASPLLMMLAN